MIKKKTTVRANAGRPSFLVYDTDKSYLSKLLINMREMGHKIIEHLQVNVGKSSHATRKAATIERKIAELINLIEKL